MNKAKLVYPFKLKIRGKEFDDTWIFYKHPVSFKNERKHDWFAALNYKKKIYYLLRIEGTDTTIKGKDFTKVFGKEPMP